MRSLLSGAISPRAKSGRLWLLDNVVEPLSCRCRIEIVRDVCLFVFVVLSRNFDLLLFGERRLAGDGFEQRREMSAPIGMSRYVLQSPSIEAGDPVCPGIFPRETRTSVFP